MNEVPQVYFKTDGSFGFEIIKLEELFKKNNSFNHNPFQPHRLSFFAILYFKSSKSKADGEHYIDFERVKFNKQSLVFISNEQIHAFSNCINNFKGYLIVFTDDFIRPLNISAINQVYNYQLFNPVVHLPKSHNLEIDRLISQMNKEFSGVRGEIEIQILRSYLNILLHKLLPFRQTANKLEEHMYYAEFLQLQQLLKDYLLKDRSVKFYADEMLISTKKLNAICQAIVQLSAKAYITNLLILEIKRQLANTNKTVKEICYNTGFDEPTNFVKFFKKNTNQAPLQFRNTLKS